ncbi:putative C6 finger domain protein [Lasiosphaeris hirsuta]|uniref:C6 finger domain protein n=1 Tax=Lasiosphaeris hirsuta TaxID=260670 RepID=A0AA40E891_9PEZI|nr:putative C6 finger domain protein [Lasiosphaeris hirsuta]
MNTTSTPSPQTRKRHCWECLRRCLVCDSTRPACKRCSASGTACPGYDETKPARLRWLAPGRVTSRTTRKSKGGGGGSAPSPPTDEDKSGGSASVDTAQVAAPQTNDSMAVSRFEMRTEACDLVQAVQYFNTCIYQELLPMHELGPNPFIYAISPSHIQQAIECPEYLRLSMVCMALSHRLSRTTSDAHTNALNATFYRYRGIVIRSISQDIAREQRHTSNAVLAGVMFLLLADVQQGASPHWRCHLEGFQRLLAMRGGLRALAASKPLGALIRCFVFISVIGNTTCPASDLVMADLHLADLDIILNHYSGEFLPFQMCPPPLFGDIIRINHLRMRARAFEATEARGLSQEALEVLERIRDYSPREWAESKVWSTEDWLLVGEIYRATTALYCILSLQSVSLLPQSPSLSAQCTRYGQDLYTLLSQGLPSPKTKRFMIWPLVVLGVEAVRGGATVRAFVARELPEIGRHVGTHVPLTAKRVLQRFWTSDATSWDACFDRPFAFATQISVDVSEIMP